MPALGLSIPQLRLVACASFNIAAARILFDLRAAAMLGMVLLGAVDLCMFANRMLGMVAGMEMVRMRNMCVVGGFLMVAGFVMLCRLGVMVCSLRVVMGSLRMMVRRFL